MHAWLRLLTAYAVICCTSALAAPVADATIFTTRGEVPLKLEVAATPEARTQGLMQRDTLKPYDGMLFLFPEPHDYLFWMKNTMVPLDMLFVCAGMHIVYVEENAAPYSLQYRKSGKDDVIAVIELDGGRAAREGIAQGDHVRYELPKEVTVR